MAAWKEWLRRAKYVGRRSRFDRELDEEIQFHLETRVDELQRDGVSLQEARARARREFGSRVQMQEDTRAAWQFPWLDDAWRDLRYALRAFRRNPAFAAVAMLSLGIGVGANCVMFSLVDAALLRPPRVPRPNDLVVVVSTAKTLMRPPARIRTITMFASATGACRRWPHSPPSRLASPGRALSRAWRTASSSRTTSSTWSVRSQSAAGCFWRTRLTDPKTIGR